MQQASLDKGLSLWKEIRMIHMDYNNSDHPGRGEENRWQNGKKIDASTFTDFSVSGDEKRKKDVDLSYFDDPGIIEPVNVHQSPFDIGTIPADMVRSEDDWEHKTYPGALWPDPGQRKSSMPGTVSSCALTRIMPRQPESFAPRGRNFYICCRHFRS